MTTPEIVADQAWAAVADADEVNREGQMVERYTELAAMPDEERFKRMHSMALAEYALGDEQLRSFTMSRLKVLLTLQPEVARQVVSTYDAVMNKMPATAAMRRVALVQTLAREFSTSDQQRLVDLVPHVFGQHPAEVAWAGARTPAEPRQRKRPWWAFWQKQ